MGYADAGFLDFIKTLYNTSALHGYTSEEINYLKQKSGTIPEVLEKFYLEAGKTKEFQYGQDRWITPDDYKKYSWLEKIDGLVLLNENQSVCQAYIQSEDLHLPDPPVYICYDDIGGEKALCTPSTSEFLVAMLAYQAAFTFEYNPEDFYYVDWEDIEKFQSRLVKYPFEIKNWLYDTQITFYSNDPCNLVAALASEGAEDDGLQIIYGAVSKEAYNKLEKALDGICEPL